MPLRRWRSGACEAVAVPILKQGDVLIASIQGALSDRDLVQVRDDVADQVGRFRSRGVVIDVTALDVLDSFATRTLRAIAFTAKLRGAHTVVVGIQPEVAFSMVQLGLSLDGVTTVLDLEEGLAYLRDLAKAGGSRVR
jgi:rsbT antagonist protein RsbS